jgi:hypothetical protein
MEMSIGWNKYVYIFLIAVMSISVVCADTNVTEVNVSTTTYLTDIDMNTVAGINVTISNGYITSPIHNKIVIDPVSKPDLTNLTETEIYDLVDRYIVGSANITGKSTVVSDNQTMNITVYSMENGFNGGITFNLSATLNGQSLLIHNPFTVHGVSPNIYTIAATNITYPDPSTNFSVYRIYDIENPNVSRSYTESEIATILSTPSINYTYTIIESPNDAVLQSLYDVLKYIPYGEPTF